MAEAKRTCTTPNCDKPVRGRGLCTMHYQRAVKSGALPTTWANNRADIERVDIKCPCGSEMLVTTASARRKRYCSQACKYRYRTRPRGLEYKIVADNPTWIRPGDTPWNLGLRDEETPNWKGDNVGYCGLHSWVRKTRTKTGKCEHCGSAARPTEWSNISFEYRRSKDDWQELCRLCHMRYDRAYGWGEATRRFA